MPKMVRRNKNLRSGMGVPRRTQSPTGAKSVKDLLAKLPVNLTRVTDQAARQKHWRGWLETHLPSEMASRLSGVVEREGTLVVFAESPAWCSRLRYAIEELRGQIQASDPAITEVSVRVLPRGEGKGGGR
jgi:hypothetical protein